MDQRCESNILYIFFSPPERLLYLGNVSIRKIRRIYRRRKIIRKKMCNTKWTLNWM